MDGKLNRNTLPWHHLNLFYKSYWERYSNDIKDSKLFCVRRKHFAKWLCLAKSRACFFRWSYYQLYFAYVFFFLALALYVLGAASNVAKKQFVHGLWFCVILYTILSYLVALKMKNNKLLSRLKINFQTIIFNIFGFWKMFQGCFGFELNCKLLFWFVDFWVNISRLLGACMFDTLLWVINYNYFFETKNFKFG